MRWVELQQFPDYEVSDSGNVRRKARVRGGYRSDRPARTVDPVELKPAVTRGYNRVCLYTPHGDKVSMFIHVLVCEAFHGERPNSSHQVRHLDGDNFNNRAENLCWGTASENQQDVISHGRNFNLNKTHCVNGHPFDSENTYNRADRPGYRECKQCRRDSCNRNRQTVDCLMGRP